MKISALQVAFRHLINASMGRRHQSDLLDALFAADPIIARLHIEATGGDRGCAEVALALAISPGAANRTVLEEYLMGNRKAALEAVRCLIEEIARHAPKTIAKN